MIFLHSGIINVLESAIEYVNISTKCLTGNSVIKSSVYLISYNVFQKKQQVDMTNMGHDGP